MERKQVYLLPSSGGAINLYQYDKGIKIIVDSSIIEENSSYNLELHFSMPQMRNAFRVKLEKSENYYIGQIPNVLLMLSGSVLCYLYLNADNFGYVIREFSLQIEPRSKPFDIEYTPAEENQFTSMMAQLKDAIRQVKKIEEQTFTISNGELYLVSKD